MNLADLGKLAGIVASVVGPIFAFFLWWHKRVINKLEQEAEKARQDAFDARAAKQEAETRRDEAVMAKNVAVEEKEDILAKARDLRSRYDTTKKLLAETTTHRDKVVADLAASGATHQRKLHENQSGWERFAAAKKEEIERLLGEKAVLLTERDALAAKLAEKKEEVRDSRKEIRDVLKQQGRVWLSKVAKDAPVFRPMSERRAVVIAVLNLKGGVGKTTISANLAGYFGEQDKKVLLIDLDHQRSLTQMLLTDAERISLVRMKKSIQTFFVSEVKDGQRLSSNSVKVPGMPNCELIANHDPEFESEGELGLEELEMQMMISWLLEREKTEDVRFHLRRGLHDSNVSNTYDYVFLDCPPRFSTACVNALAAADFVLIPVQAEAVASQSVAHLLFRLRAVRECGACPSLRALGILGSQLKATPQALPSSPEFARLLEIAETIPFDTWPEPIRPFKSALQQSTRYFEASRELEQGGKLRLAIDFPSVKTQYEQLAIEIQERIRDHRNSQ